MKKYVASVLATVSILPLTAADKVTLGDVFTELQGLFSGGGSPGGFISTFVGYIQSSLFNVPLEQVDALMFFSTAGLLLLMTYILIEKAVEVADVEDMFTTESGTGTDRSESKRRLAAIALLIYLTFAASGAFAPVIIAIGKFGIPGLAVLTIALIFIYLVLGGGKYLKGGGKEFVAGGRQKLAEGHEAEADARENLKEAARQEEKAKEMETKVEEIEGEIDDILNGEKSILREGDLRDSEQNIEVLIGKFRNLEKALEALESFVDEEVSRVHKANRDEVVAESDLEDALEESEEEMEDVLEDFKKIESIGGSSASPAAVEAALSNKNDISEMLSAIDEAEGAIEEEKVAYQLLNQDRDIIQKLESLETRLDDQMDFLDEEIGGITDIQRKAEELADQMGTDDEDKRALQKEEQELGSIRERFGALIERWQKIENKISNTKGELKNLEEKQSSHKEMILRIEEVAEQIQDLLESGGRVEQHLEDAFGPQKVRDFDQSLRELKKRVRDAVDAMS